jgi:hypothetical protein
MIKIYIKFFFFHIEWGFVDSNILDLLKNDLECIPTLI